MPNTVHGAHGAATLRPLTWRSAVKRAALGLLIIAVSMGSVAWLTYASIEPDTGPAAKAPAPADTLPLPLAHL